MKTTTKLWLGLLAALLAVGQAQALEWVAPPGMNVEAQERQLKNRMMQIGRDVAGDKLIEVTVHIGYVRVGGEPGQESMEKIKLPGFDRYIDLASGSDEIVPEFARSRQVFVMVSDDVESRPAALEKEFIRQGGIRPEQGDRLRVILVKRGELDQAKGREEKEEREEEREEEAAAPRDEPPGLEAKRPAVKKGELLAETKASLYLVRAREFYFQGDLTASLDQIMQAISIEPANPQAFSMLGSIYYAMRWKSLAMKYWEKSLELDPDNHELQNLVTQVRLESRR